LSNTSGKIKYKYKRKTTWKIKNAYTEDKTRIRLAFTSTDINFLKTIASHLKVNHFRISPKLRKHIVYTLWIEAREDTKKCFEYLYKDANYFLKRKYDKVLNFNKTIKSQALDTSKEGLETT